MGLNTLAEGAASSVNGAVRSVLTACRRDDPEAKLATYTLSEGRTLIRLRPGAGSSDEGVSAASLAASLAARLPLASTSVFQSCLDGSLETSVEVPTRTAERRRARELAAREPCARRLCGVATLLVLAALAAGAVVLVGSGR
jgi:hypothetical protein